MATVIPITGSSGIFEGATLSNAFSGVLVSQTNATAGDFSANDGSELAYNIINHLYGKIATQTADANGADNVRTSTSTSLSDTQVTKTFTFIFDLGFDVGSLNVVDE